MTAPLVRIRTFVDARELPLVEAAGALLATALADASGAPWRVDLEPGDPKAPTSDGAANLVSFAAAADADAPWPEVEARLRSLCATLAQGGGPVFICTVLRHVADGAPSARLSRLVRIRRLNLLAAIISHETGAFVVDIDRALADVGALRLGADDRLQSPAARDHAARLIAASIAANGLDDLASVEIQDQAAAVIARHQPDIGLPTQLRPQQLLAVGRGRRRQVAAVDAVSDAQRHLFLIRQIMTGRLSLAAAAVIFLRAVRHVGFRESLRLLLSAVRRLAGLRAQG